MPPKEHPRCAACNKPVRAPVRVGERLLCAACAELERLARALLAGREERAP